MPQHITFPTMGTYFHATLCGIGKQDTFRFQKQLEKVFVDWEITFSRFRKDSELMELNSRTGFWTRVSNRMFSVLEICKKLAEQTHGTFDPSVGSYLASSGYGLPKNYKSPAPVPTYLDIELDSVKRRVKCKKQQILEPAAIVKGMAIDEASKVLVDIEGWMINVGGDILTKGPYDKQKKWNIGIQHPIIKDSFLTTIAITDCAIATSGTYEVTKKIGSKKWNHQISMKNGESLESIVSVTLVADTSQRADTLASIAILKGLNEGIEYLTREKVPYFILDINNEIHKNNSFSKLEYTT